MSAKEPITHLLNQSPLSSEMGARFLQFYDKYLQEGKKGGESEEALDLLVRRYLAEINNQINTPFSFDLFHEKIRAPFDFYAFGLGMFRPLIDFKASHIEGMEHLHSIQSALDRGENVVLFSNHQTEADPQAIHLLLEKFHPKLAGRIIFIAGHRVTTDPFAVPFSKGTDILCIFSKNYIESPPEQKYDKLMHNRRTMQKMRELLSVGGKCIYVAASGGRDRPGADGTVDPAPFDPNSIEMFYLMAKNAGCATHFHTLALATYALLPPPKTIVANLGELRLMNYTSLQLAFGPEIPMESCFSQDLDKIAAREARAHFIWNRVQSDYKKIYKTL